MIRFLYRHLLKPLLFRLDPEWVHDVFVDLGEVLGRYALARRLVSMAYGYPAADAFVTVDGLQYRTPIVLAAGFDYNGRLCQILRSVGFGGVEVGSVTARPTAGDPPPRLARLVRSRSLLVNKGLRNDGVECIAQRLRKVARSDDFIVGVSIARTNDAQATGKDHQ